MLRLLLFGVLSLFGALGLTYLLGRRVVERSIAPILNSVERVAEGDFMRRVEASAVRDELVGLSSSLNRLFETIERDKKQIHRISSILSEKKKSFSRSRSEDNDRLTEIEQHTERLQESLHTLIETAWEGMAVFDQTGRILHANAHVRRMIALERRGGDLFIPARVQRMIAKLFASSQTERAEGAFEAKDGVLKTESRFRFRAERLSYGDNRQKVLLVLEAISPSDRLERQSSGLSALLTRTIVPAVQGLQELGRGFDPEAQDSGELIDAIEAGCAYIERLVEDWAYWEQECCRREELEEEQQVNLLELVRSLKLDSFAGFSKGIQYHLPPVAATASGREEDYRWLLREALILLQLAVPGEQESAIDFLSEPDALIVLFRKGARGEGEWSPPGWVERLNSGAQLSQDSWIDLKLSIVQFLAHCHQVMIGVDCQAGGVSLSLSFPLKQPKNSEDMAVDELIKRFFVAHV